MCCSWLLILFMFLCLNQQRRSWPSFLIRRCGARTSPRQSRRKVKPNAMYAINTKPVAGPQLAARLRAIYAGRPTKTIIVRGAPGVRFQDVVTAVDIAKGAGVIAIGLVKAR